MMHLVVLLKLYPACLPPSAVLSQPVPACLQLKSSAMHGVPDS